MGKFVEKVKTGAKKTWTWIKAHPGETCLMVGSAIIGGVTGSKIGQRKGYKVGYVRGGNDTAAISWGNHCKDYGFDPNFSHASFDSMKGVSVSAAKWIEGLSELDPERKMSGRLVYDDTLVQDNDEPGPNAVQY